MSIVTHTPEGDHVETTREEARQGQNIQGMLAVLVISILLVVAAYGVMLAVFGGGEQTDKSPAADITSESGVNPVPAVPPPPTPQ